MNRPFRIPTIVGIILVLLVVGVIVVIERVTRSATLASGSTELVNVQTTNITDSSFTLTWMTETPSTGVVYIVSDITKPLTFYDDRDTNGELNEYISHSVTAHGLSAQSTYSIEIVSQKGFSKSTKKLTATTGTVLEPQPNGFEPAYGTIVFPDNTPARDALVYISLDGSQKLSTITKPSGTWVIPLNLTRLQDNLSYVPVEERSTVYIEVAYGSDTAAAITDTLNDAPVPVMALGKTYDFRKQQATKTDPKPETAVLGVASSTNTTIAITQPKNGATLTSARPLIGGTAIAGNKVAITLGITNPTSTVVTTGPDGMFRYTPEKNLAPGKQSVTITTTDKNNKPVAATHIFNIFKSGTQVLGDATPSGELTPTPVATAGATPTPVDYATPTPDLTGQEVPTTGSPLPLLILSMLGIMIIGSGLVLYAKEPSSA